MDIINEVKRKQFIDDFGDKAMNYIDWLNSTFNHIMIKMLETCRDINDEKDMEKSIEFAILVSETLKRAIDEYPERAYKLLEDKDLIKD